MKWVEPWFSAYAAVGMLILGVAPILIPLSVESSSNSSASLVGLIVAAFYVGGLFAPALGSLIDKHGMQRSIFIGSFPVMALAVTAYAFADSLAIWAITAFIFGGIGSLSGTIASLFIVEDKPENEWNHRLSWFRLAYGAGQVVGLIIAALTATLILAGWLLTAAVLLIATFLAFWKLPHLQPVHAPKKSDQFRPATQSPHRTLAVRFPFGVHHHIPTSSSESGYGQKLDRSSKKNTPYRYPIFIAAWLLIMAGVQTFFNVVPLVMRDAFGINPTASSLLFLLGAAAGTTLYPLAGDLANKFGPGLVLLIGLFITAAAFGVMALSIWVNAPNKAVVGMLGLVLAATAYSFEVVAATMMVVRLAPGTEGGAVGLLNALIAGGAVIGALVPGFLATLWGYPALPAVAFTAVIAGALVAIPLFSPGQWKKQLASQTNTTNI